MNWKSVALMQNQIFPWECFSKVWTEGKGVSEPILPLVLSYIIQPNLYKKFWFLSYQFFCPIFLWV